ncbi:hypothetical protein HOO68_01615 [Candidatus Gracilibacteria bacterium]|nr:hypothetical protein [Candidatus Gracilibacteria bacterium]
MQKFFLIIFKLFLLVIIIAAGAGATCGGNLLLGDFVGNIGDDFGFIIWGIEVLIILIYGIRFLFFSIHSGNLKKLVITTLLIGLICGGVFLAVCGGINLF